MNRTKLSSNERAVSMVEYMVLAAAISLVALYAVTSLSRSTKDSFCLAGSILNDDTQLQNCVKFEPGGALEPTSPCTDCEPVEGGECSTPSACHYDQNIRCEMTKDCIEDCSGCPPPSNNDAPPNSDEPNPDDTPPPPDCSVEAGIWSCPGNVHILCLRIPSYSESSNTWSCTDDCSNCPPDPNAPGENTYP